jgi:type I restriction enzyme, R subunit
MSQFAFLKDEFPDIFAHAARAENFAHSDPRAAAFYGRLAKPRSTGFFATTAP